MWTDLINLKLLPSIIKTINKVQPRPITYLGSWIVNRGIDQSTEMLKQNNVKHYKLEIPILPTSYTYVFNLYEKDSLFTVHDLNVDLITKGSCMCKLSNK